MIKKIKSFLFLNQHTKQTVAKNTFWLLFGEITSRALRAIIIIYAARYLGADNLGIFSYVITLASFFTIFSDLGLTAILTKETAKNPEMKDKYLSTSFFIKISLAGLMSLVSIFGAPYLAKDPQIKILIPIVALILIFDGLREFSFAINRAKEKMELEAGAKIIANFAIVLISFIFLSISKSPAALVWGYATGSAIGFIYSAWTLRNEIKTIFHNFTKKLVWPIFSSAWPFALSGFLGGIMINTDTIMLEWIRSLGELGIYSAVQKPIYLLYTIPNIFAAALFPSMAKMAKRDNEGFRKAMEKSICIMTLIALPIALIGMFLSKDIIFAIFGNEYIAGSLSLQILFLTIPIIFISSIISNALFAYDEQKKFGIYLAIGAISNVILNYFFITWWGIAGCSAATLLAQIISNAYLWLSMKKVNDFEILNKLKKIIIASLIALIFTILFKISGINFFINGIISLLAYLGILLILKETSIKDIKGAFK